MKKVKLKQGPCGSKSSNNNNIGSCKEFILGHFDGCEIYQISTLIGEPAGWVYKYEIENFSDKIEDLQKEKIELSEKLTEINAKIKWMDENGITVFDEKEFNVYQTLTLLEDESISKIEKTKLIANLIK